MITATLMSRPFASKNTCVSTGKGSKPHPCGTFFARLPVECVKAPLTDVHYYKTNSLADALEVVSKDTKTWNFPAMEALAELA